MSYYIIMSKIGLTEREILGKCETKELTRVNSEPIYIGFQVCNAEICGNVATITSIRGQVNGLVGDYMSYTP